MSDLSAGYKLLILLVAWMALGGGGAVAQKPTAVTYVHEQRTNEVPQAVRGGLSKLNEAGIVATVFDVDTIDKQGGETPEQYKVPLAAAKKLPSLVATNGSKVIRVVENPQTEAEVMEAAK